MITPQSLIDEQTQLERDQISQGLKSLRDNTMRLEDKSYASASVYGIASIDTILPLVVKSIEDTHNRIHAGHTGIAFKDIHQYLKGLEPLAAAAIACKITFDKVFSLLISSAYFRIFNKLNSTKVLIIDRAWWTSILILICFSCDRYPII